ncbi:hypothetical protein [Microbispora sitophila]|uniref:hypothetical protein n=1 Tax=Microbispora sitophila TaxID=2771537 RepID=UPI00299F69C4|nr:hypothetical protein [Microbispora sitophila]
MLVTKSLRLPPEYHGIHPAAAQEGHEEVVWHKCQPRVSRVRVRRHTCGCKPLMFELCQAGGLLFVRRTENRTTVTETEWLRAALAEQLWHKILLGQAR